MPETYQGSSLASWGPITTTLVVFAAILAFLHLYGRPRPDRPFVERTLLRIPDGLERLTGIPGWAAASAGLAMYGLFVAGQGFYSDVAWHVALGRDDELFTAPHTGIIVGLVFIALSSMFGVLIATLDRVDTPLRLGALRVPWSMVPLAALGAAAVSGFPLDEIWHSTYGIDVTMWSPTHMLMILGASFTGLGIWLVIAEAGVRVDDGPWARVAHVLGAVLTLLGLSASQGEFAFGVPQYQAIFLPILVSAAAGFALVAGRIVHGPFWMLGITSVLFGANQLGFLDEQGAVDTRQGAMYVVSALVVELVAFGLGTGRRLRFALASGLGVGTIGLAGEWWWNQNAYQPWRSSLLPDAVIFATLAALGAAVLGAGFANAVRRRPTTVGGLSSLAFVLAGIAVVGSLAVHLDSDVGDVRADIRIQRIAGDGSGADEAFVEVTLDPVDAADDARWFQLMTWQGGGLVAADMEPTGEPGVYVSSEPTVLDGLAKTTVRLHRDDEMMLVPIAFPADDEIDAEPIVPTDRDDVPFEAETDYLQREVVDGARTLSQVIHGLLALAVVAWAITFALAARALGGSGSTPVTVEDRPLVDA